MTTEEQPNSKRAARMHPKSSAIFSPNNHPIAAAINLFLHRTQDIKACLAQFIPVAIQEQSLAFDKLKIDLKDAGELLQSTDGLNKVTGLSRTLKAMRSLDRLSNSHIPKMLETSLFIGMFSAYDAYIGQLIRAIYERNPELFTKINRQIQVSELTNFQSIEEILSHIVEDEIEAFRRKSYVEQFAELETSFGLQLRKFERWPDFVECSQRRNLFTHCDGVVSQQYLAVCKAEGYKFQEPVVIGDQLLLGGKYFVPKCELMMEVGLKLGQTLWRKLFPDELVEADKHLNHVVYNALHFEHWGRATVFARFATSLDISRKSSDLYKKMATVNLAIALKCSGEPQEAKALLDQSDWSGSLNEFKLAEAILNERFEDAVSVMKRIGKAGEILDEAGYHTWPLFRDFRKHESFHQAYEDIYGYSFATKLQSTADKEEQRVSKIIQDVTHQTKALEEDTEIDTQ